MSNILQTEVALVVLSWMLAAYFSMGLVVALMVVVDEEYCHTMDLLWVVILWPLFLG